MIKTLQLKHPLRHFPPSRERPKIRPERPKAMTFILGMRCLGGVIIGADTEVNTDVSKHRESKIRRSSWNDDAPFFFTYTSNNLLFTEDAMNRLGKVIKKAGQHKCVDAVRGECRLIAAENTDKELSLILSIKLGQIWNLFQIHNDVVAEVPKATDGSGYYHANRIMQEFYDPRMPLSQAALLAVYLLKVAKDNAPGVGGPSEILLLRDYGGWEKMHHAHVEDIEKAFEHLESGLRGLILDYVDWGLRDEFFDKKLSDFSDKLRRYRKHIGRLREQQAQDENLGD
jgi:hypothetical protein